MITDSYNVDSSARKTPPRCGRSGDYGDHHNDYDVVARSLLIFCGHRKSVTTIDARA